MKRIDYGQVQPLDLDLVSRSRYQRKDEASWEAEVLRWWVFEYEFVQWLLELPEGQIEAIEEAVGILWLPNLGRVEE